MKLRLSSLGPVVLTLAVTAVGAVVVKHLWDYYTVAPWTRDGHIRADVVQVAPDVSGLVTRIAVKDNQHVKAGDVLFEIDHERYALALRQAEATAAAVRANLGQARREASRSQKLSDVVSKEIIEEGLSKVQQGEAQLAQEQRKYSGTIGTSLESHTDLQHLPCPRKRAAQALLPRVYPRSSATSFATKS